MTCAISDKCAAFGKITAATPACAHNCKSCANHSESALLIRKAIGLDASHHAATAVRAASFSVGGTASSKSMMTTSAPAANALSNLSGRFPGTNK